MDFGGCPVPVRARRTGARYAEPMDRELLTAEDLDAMTPNERAAAFDERIVSSWDEVSPEFRAQVEATASRLSAERARQG